MQLSQHANLVADPSLDSRVTTDSTRFPVVMPAKQSAHRASANAIAQGARQIKKAANSTWRLAPKTPMFTRKSSKTVAGKKKVVRTKRLISNHAFKIHASGGAAYANAVIQAEAKAYRLDVGRESKRVPWLPSVAPGAIAILEQFLCAYAQTATQNAMDIRVGLNSHKRLNGKLMKLGYDQADATIFGSSMPAPRTTLICAPVAKKRSKAKEGEAKEGEEEEDGDYEAPDAEE